MFLDSCCIWTYRNFRPDSRVDAANLDIGIAQTPLCSFPLVASDQCTFISCEHGLSQLPRIPNPSLSPCSTPNRLNKPLIITPHLEAETNLDRSIEALSETRKSTLLALKGDKSFGWQLMTTLINSIPRMKKDSVQPTVHISKSRESLLVSLILTLKLRSQVSIFMRYIDPCILRILRSRTDFVPRVCQIIHSPRASVLCCSL
jgi:hypothetical protein